MNNFGIGLQRFFKNKNVVTVLGVIAILVALFIGYSTSIKSKTKPINLPVAAKKITPRTKISSGDVTYAQVPESMVSENVLRSSFEIIDKYSNINVTIPQGSVFYKEWVVDANKVPGNWVEALDSKKGEIGYYMSVDFEDTLGNTILPNTYIDIYMKATDENGTIMFGRLMKNIKVLVVHDESGNDVFADSESIGIPSKLGFAVNQDYYILFKKAEYLRIDLTLVPRGSQPPKKEGIVVTSATLRDYIDAKTITISEDIIAEETEENKGQVSEGDATVNPEAPNNNAGTPTPIR